MLSSFSVVPPLTSCTVALFLVENVIRVTMNYVQNFKAEFCPLHSQFRKKACAGLHAKVKLKLCAVLRRDFFFPEVWPEFEMVDNFKRESFGSDKSGEVQVLPFDKIKYRDQDSI